MGKKKTTGKRKSNEISIWHRGMTIIGILMCVVLLPMLILNITLIIKSFINTEEVPSVGGYLPMIVLTDSMYPGIQSGDLIICHTLEPEQVEVGDVISFFDPAGNGSAVVTHRVTEVTRENDGLAFRTKGDANNAEDAELVPAENLVGIYRTRLAGVGNIAMFMQTTAGLVICVVCPLVVLVGYDIIRRRKYEREKRQDTEALLAELETLKAQKAQRAQSGEQKVQQRRRTGAGTEAARQRRRTGARAEAAPQRRRTGAGTEAARQRRHTGAGAEAAPQRRRTGAGAEAAPQRRRTGAGTEAAPQRRRTEAGTEAAPQRRRIGAGTETAPRQHKTAPEKKREE